MAAILVTRLEISLVIGPCEEPSPCPSEEGAQHLPDFDWLQTVVPKGLEREGLYCRVKNKGNREQGSRYQAGGWQCQGRKEHRQRPWGAWWTARV